jgi:hypothetical protein
MPLIFCAYFRYKAIAENARIHLFARQHDIEPFFCSSTSNVSAAIIDIFLLLLVIEILYDVYDASEGHNLLIRLKKITQGSILDSILESHFS